MLPLFPLLLASTLLLAYLYYYLQMRRPPGYPPGPPVYPLLGCLPGLKVSWGSPEGGYQLQEELRRCAKEYGSIFSIAIGHQWIIVITEYSLLKEALVKMGNDFAGRKSLGDITAAWNPYIPTYGIIDGTVNEQWKLQRHTALQVLRSLGFGRQITQNIIIEEAEDMIQNFISNNQKPFSPEEYISHAITNVIISLLCGERYELGDGATKNIVHNMNEGFANLQKTIGFGTIPGGKFLPAYQKYKKNTFDGFKDARDFLHRKIAENPLEEGVSEARNFIEGYRLERQKNPKLDDRLYQLLMDFLEAGLETTTTTLGWAIYFMTVYPEVQRKIHEEMDKVVGSRRPVDNDRTALPYTMATLYEIMRLATTVPIPLSHRTMKTCQLGGYTIPEGAGVWVHIWSVLRDPNIWPDPLVLKPERFLDDEGQFLQREEFMAFGLGRRSCLGEQLAKQQMFILFTHLLHRFTLSSPDGSVESVAVGLVSITHKPPEYQVIATSRG